MGLIALAQPDIRASRLGGAAETMTRARTNIQTNKYALRQYALVVLTLRGHASVPV